MTAIELDDVSFTYPGSTRPALNSVTAGFSPGTVTLVTGPLGAGCSTLLLVASGLAPHVTGGRRTGKVAVLGRDPSVNAERRALGGLVGLLLPTPWTQLSGLAPTVADEVAFGPANHGWPLPRITDAVGGAMERGGIAHLADRDPVTLSGGEVQRVMLAALMAMEPQVYLLDEPALELDPSGADALYRLLPELARTATVIVASTDVDRAAEVAGRVLLLKEGRCIADGSPDSVLGSDAAADLRASTTVAAVARMAGLGAPYPITVSAALRRLGP